jgi:hypothetical protein
VSAASEFGGGISPVLTLSLIAVASFLLAGCFVIAVLDAVWP